VGSSLDATPDPVIAVDPVGSIVEAALGPDGLATATFDKSRDYRYRLSRVWDDSLPRIVWCMLNPSTASAFRSDPTIIRVVKFSRRWGFGAAEVVNLFALRSPSPTSLRWARDPVGPGNDAAVADAVTAGHLVVAAWGNGGSVVNPLTGTCRSDEVRGLLDRRDVEVSCLRLTKSLQPGHPLYVRSDTARIIWSRPSY
jgi:hypothetical protein